MKTILRILIIITLLSNALNAMPPLALDAKIKVTPKSGMYYSESDAKGAPMVFIPFPGRITITPTIINTGSTDVTVITRNLNIFYNELCLQYEALPLCCKGEILKRSTAMYGIVTLKAGEVVALASYKFADSSIIENKTLVIEYNINHDLAKAVGGWGGVLRKPIYIEEVLFDGQRKSQSNTRKPAEPPKSPEHPKDPR